jgi:hypothetical protein
MMMCCYVWSSADFHRHFCCDIRESLTAIFRPVLCTTADSARDEPRQPLSIDCTSVWPSAPGRTQSRTDGLPDRRPTSRATCRLVSRHLSIFLATQFNHVQKYGDRFYDFSVLILSFWLYIAAKKTKKKAGKKAALSHSGLFFTSEISPKNDQIYFLLV